MSVKKTPIDIESILEYGIDRWYDEFDWPLSWQEFLTIENKCKKVLNDHIEKYSDYADLILINYKVFKEFSNFIYALYIIKNNNDILVSSKNTYYKSIIDNEIPKYAFYRVPKHKKKQNLLIRKMKYFKYLYKYNKNNFSINSKIVFVLLESSSGIALKYIKDNNLGRIKPVSFYDYFPEDEFEIAQSEIKEIIKIVESINDDIYEIANDYDLKFSVKQKKYFINLLNGLFLDTYRVLKNIEAGINGRKLTVYIGGNNNYFTRIFSVAVRNSGGKIHGFTHGEPMIYDWDKVSWIDLSLNDYFYEYNDLLANELKLVTDKYPPLNNNVCEIRSIKSNSLNNSKSKCTTLLKKHSCIMLIGNAYLNTGMSAVTAMHLPMQLHIELSIIKSLRKQGFRVKYKPHPEGYFRNKTIDFMPSDVDIIYGRFEKQMDIVDGFAFYYTGTTTFGVALNSDKPIMFFDYGITPLTNKMLEIIRNRCIIRKVNNNVVKKNNYYN